VKWDRITFFFNIFSLYSFSSSGLGSHLF